MSVCTECWAEARRRYAADVAKGSVDDIRGPMWHYCQILTEHPRPCDG